MRWVGVCPPAGGRVSQSADSTAADENPDSAFRSRESGGRSEASDGFERLARSLPVGIARVSEGRLLLDLRTVLPSQEAALVERLVEVLSKY